MSNILFVLVLPDTAFLFNREFIIYHSGYNNCFLLAIEALLYALDLSITIKQSNIFISKCIQPNLRVTSQTNYSLMIRIT